MVYDAAHKGFFAHLGDDLHCADRGPRTYVLKPGPGAVLLASYRADAPAAGLTGSITVTASVPWTAASSDPWVTITGGGSGNGSGKVNYQISANPLASPRTGRIIINDKIMRLDQPGTLSTTITGN